LEDFSSNVFVLFCFVLFCFVSVSIKFVAIEEKGS
jgi:hypothetical protein